jgi:DmsE family decaheme c-type cytochrome
MALFRMFHSPGVRPLSPSARRLRAALLGVVLAAGPVTLARGAQDKPGAPAAPAAAAAKPAEFAGSVTCQGCHEDIFNAFQKSPHQLVETDKKRGFEEKACESCHGPGSKHAESMSAADIRNPAKLKPAETDKTCLTCHLNQPTHIGRINSSHAKNQVSCASCHSVHKNGPNGLVARKATAINAQCAGCHNDVWASFQRPYRHRLPEGAMSCVDCHNPHGTFLPRSVQTANANEPGCYKCHGDKRGPFVYEHAPVKTEGCQSCHQVHGSANPMSLTRAQVRFVCMECHSNLPQPAAGGNAGLGTVGPALHDLRNPRFQNCTLCHQKVHGSNVNRDLFK